MYTHMHTYVYNHKHMYIDCVHTRNYQLRTHACTHAHVHDHAALMHVCIQVTLVKISGETTLRHADDILMRDVHTHIDQ